MVGVVGVAGCRRTEQDGMRQEKKNKKKKGTLWLDGPLAAKYSCVLWK